MNTPPAPTEGVDFMARKNSFSAVDIVVRVSALCLLLVAGCSGNGDPFSYVKASGKVTYEDGSLIPAKFIMVVFTSEAPPVGNAHPLLGKAFVDTSTGEFHSVTSHTPQDGLVRGKHKVCVTGEDHHPLPADLVPVEYADPKKTPLEIDTDHMPLELKVAKPKAH
jgi:hypothetical protein